MIMSRFGVMFFDDSVRAFANLRRALPERELKPYISQLGPLARVLPQVDEAKRAPIIDAARAAFDPFVHGAEVHFTAGCWTIGARAPR